MDFSTPSPSNIAAHPSFDGFRNLTQQTRQLRETALMLAVQRRDSSMVEFILDHEDCPRDVLRLPQKQWPYETALVKLCQVGTGELEHSDWTFLRATEGGGGERV
eukprot:g20614.t1